MDYNIMQMLSPCTLGMGKTFSFVSGEVEYNKPQPKGI